MTNLTAEMFVARCWLAIAALCIAGMLGGCRKGGGKPAPADTKSTEAATKAPHSYRTMFPASENPLSEDGRWMAGSAAGASLWAGGHFWTGGRLWGDVATDSGFAYGVDEPTKFGDPTAILTGSWGMSQTVSATVRIRAIPTGKWCCHEVELRLRTTITNHGITGYEAYCSVVPDEPYCHIARWNGPNGSYWNFETGSSAVSLRDGDVVSATVSGTNPVLITLYRNGEQILQATDIGAAGGGFGAFGPWTSGNPGIGFYNDHDGNWRDFGFSSFSAADGNP